MKRLDQPENKTWNKKIVNWIDNLLSNFVKEEPNMETEQKPISFKTSLIVVVALHLIAFYFVFAFDTKKANANTIKEETSIAKADKEFLEQDKYVGVEYPMDSKPPEVKSKPVPTKIIYYTIKKGDTFTSIARNNKISITRLQKLNKIKDTSKIYVGQRLVLN